MERVIDCELLLVIVKEGVNKSDHPTQNPLLLVTEPRTSDTSIQLIDESASFGVPRKSL
jgi:hypothetical protein